MLPAQLRVLLAIGAFASLWVVCSKVRKNKVLVEDAIFWMVLAVALVVLAIFPQIAIAASQLLGFVSPSNFVYLIVIVLLLWKTFANATEISQLKARVNELAQEVALARIKETSTERRRAQDRIA